MPLTLNRLKVQQVQLGDHTGFSAGVLTVDSDDLAGTLTEAEPRVKSVSVYLAQPGESVRILCVKDVIQPSVKLEGEEWGNGRRLLLEDVAVITLGPIVGFQEGIIDMSGPGAAYSPFSEIPLIALEFDVLPGLQPHEHEEALRRAGLLAGEYLARKCLNTAEVEEQEVLWDEVDVAPNLPRVAYVLMALSQGLLHDSYVMGVNADHGLPVMLDPRVILDAGLVSGNCVSACDKNTSFHHRNNPLVSELLGGHGSLWNLVGVVVTNQPVRLAAKESSAAAAVKLVVRLKAQGAIVSKEGFGNPDADLMMILRGLEQQGVKAVGITDEFAGTDGGSQSLADTTPEADAIISTGNANEVLLLPPMETVIGPLPDVARLAGGYAGSLHDDGSLEVELQAIIGATNQLGYGRLRCHEI